MLHGGLGHSGHAKDGGLSKMESTPLAKIVLLNGFIDLVPQRHKVDRCSNRASVADGSRVMSLFINIAVF